MSRLRFAGAAVLLAVSIAAPVLAANDGPALTRIAYNDSRIPMLVCSTVYGCELILQVGERLRLASLMDDRWTAKVADAGTETTSPRILIAPSVADQPASDSDARAPLRTSLHALTDRREYVIDLRATAAAEQHRLGFTYTDVPAVVVRTLDNAPGATATAVPVVAPQSETPPLDPARMDFGWKTTGDATLRCVTVFSYADQLWCRMRSDLTRVPSAYYADGAKDLPLNTHVVAQRYLVIDGVTSPVALVLGGSKSVRATIVRAHE